jgi:hypothetical protein
MKAVRTAALLLSAAMVGLSTQQMSPTDALAGAYYSAAAYCAYDTLDLWTCGTPCQQFPGIKSIKRIYSSARNIFAFAAYNHFTKDIVFNFRGTNGLDIPNWYMNLNVDQDNYPPVSGGKIHSGFDVAYMSV